MKMNLPLGLRWEFYAREFGADFPPPKEQKNGKASTDQGNVSHEIPSIQGVYRIETEGGCDNHTPEFALVIDYLDIRQLTGRLPSLKRHTSRLS